MNTPSPTAQGWAREIAEIIVNRSLGYITAEYDNPLLIGMIKRALEKVRRDTIVECINVGDDLISATYNSNGWTADMFRKYQECVRCLAVKK